MAMLAPSRMDWNSRVSWPINSGSALAAVSILPGFAEASAAMEGATIPRTRCRSRLSFSTP